MTEDGQRVYEGMFLVDAGFANKDPEAAVELCKGVLEKHGATVIRAELWAEQRLAYEVRKNKRGAYILTAFRADTLKITEIELECRLTERVLRYLFLNRDGVAIESWFRSYDKQAGRSSSTDKDDSRESSKDKEKKKEEVAAS